MNSPLKRTKPVIAWPGGKSRLLPVILPLIPKHSRYVEVFAGGLAVLLAKPRSQVEIINDLNGDIVSLYLCAQFHLDELIKEVTGALYSRRLLADLQGQRGFTDIQRAARFLLINKLSFGGGMKSFGVVKNSPPRSLANIPRALRELHDRLDKVSIENLSYERMLESYDGDSTLFFLDPPYLNSRPGSAYDGWNEEQMTAFSSRVLALKGSWIVTVDDSEFNRSLFKGCKIKAVETANGSVNRRLKPASLFREIIIRP